MKKRGVYYAFLSADENCTVCAILAKRVKEFQQGQELHELVFANDRDQKNNTVPKRPIFEKVGISLSLTAEVIKFNRAVGW